VRGPEVDAFLARPLIARIAAAGPTIRPVWFLWEEQSFWWLTGGWSRLGAILAETPELALVVDTCDLASGEVLQVVARGSAEIAPFDPERARRLLARYLGPDEASWGPRFLSGTFEDSTVRFVRLAPVSLRGRDLSFRPQ
jgi:nitroimidazol reductase NimA-like FMN-containing flavoprotein (pyridoxamine 5'-phosphate oxidase superfamily)